MPPPSLPPPQDETSRSPRLAEAPAPPDQTTALDWYAIEKPQSSARGTPARQLPRPALAAKPVEIRAAAPARWSTRAVAPDAEPIRAPGSIVRAQTSEMPPSPPRRPWRGPDALSPTPPAPCSTVFPVAAVESPLPAVPPFRKTAPAAAPHPHTPKLHGSRIPKWRTKPLVLSASWPSAPYCPPRRPGSAPLLPRSNRPNGSIFPVRHTSPPCRRNWRLRHRDGRSRTGFGSCIHYGHRNCSTSDACSTKSDPPPKPSPAKRVLILESQLARDVLITQS